MHIETLTGNITAPGGVPWTFRLGEKTLLLGSNGAGKTRIFHGLNLILRAATDDLQGKNNVKSAQTLIGLAPFTGPGDLYVHGTFDNGVEGAWGVSRRPDGTIKTPDPEPPTGVDVENCFPLAAVRAALSGDQNAKKTFLEWVAHDIPVDDVKASIPPASHAKFMDIYERQHGNPIERLNAVLAYASARALEVNAEIARHEATVAKYSAGLASCPTDADIQQGRSVLQAWQGAMQRAIAYEAYTPMDRSKVEADLQVVTHNMEQARAAAGQWRAAASVPPPEYVEAPMPASIRQMEGSIVALSAVDASTTQCPCCGAHPGSAQLLAWRGYYESQVAEARAQRDALRQAHTAVLTQHATSIAEAKQGQAYWEEQYRQLERESARLSAQLSVTAPPPENPGVTAADAHAQVQKVSQGVDDLIHLAGAWSVLNTAQSELASLRTEQPAYVALAAACKEAVRSLLETHAGEFVKRVQAYLPEGWTFYLDVADDLVLGYWRDGMLHTALSGAERDAMLVAIAMVVADLGVGGNGGKRKQSRIKKRAAAESRYMLVTPEDRDRDPVTLAKLMRAWSEFPGQVVVASTKLPKGGIPKGWTVVDVDAWLREQGGPGEKVPKEESGEKTPSDKSPAETLQVKSWFYHDPSGHYVQLSEEEAADAADLAYVGGDTEKATHEALQSRPTLPPAAETDILRGLGYDDDAIALLPKDSLRRKYIVDNGVPAAQVDVLPRQITVRDPQGKLLVTLT